MKIIWRQFYYFDCHGKPGIYAPPFLPNHSHQLLFMQIQVMPKKKPITMQEACVLISLEHASIYSLETDNFEKSIHFYHHWVQWLSDQGCHIELSGNEFDYLELEESL